MPEHVAVIGAGIVGLAHAWSAAERGHSVTVFERSKVASGASIRNFGMVWPIGQPDSSRSTAICSRERWLKISEQAGIWANPYGSLHLAHHPDEWEVLQEFYEHKKNSELGKHLQLLDRQATMQRSPAANPQGLLGSLASDLEVCVNPTEAVRAIPQWLIDTYGIQFCFETAVISCQSGKLKTASGQSHGFDRILVCSGHDFETLYPQQMNLAPMRKCKLQMMRTVAQPTSWKLGAHIASGLTLRHYSSFNCCKTLQQLKARIAAQTPELDDLGIHVMASQDNHGRVVLGDSHEYGDDIEPFDTERIDSLILRELTKVIQLPDWSIDSRWHGIYAKTMDGVATVLTPEPGVHVCTGLGGAGMTMSFGVAENNWQTWSAR